MGSAFFVVKLRLVRPAVAPIRTTTPWNNFLRTMIANAWPRPWTHPGAWACHRGQLSGRPDPWNGDLRARDQRQQHGALAGEEGQVAICWRIAGGRFATDWTESGGPPVAPPTNGGFGSTVLNRMAKAALAAEVVMEHPPVSFQLNCPFSRQALWSPRHLRVADGAHGVVNSEGPRVRRRADEGPRTRPHRSSRAAPSKPAPVAAPRRTPFAVFSASTRTSAPSARGC